MATEFGDWLNETLPGFDDEAPPEGNELVADGSTYRGEYFNETLVPYHNIGLHGEEGPWGVLDGTIAYDAWKIVSDFRKDDMVGAALGAVNVGATVVGDFGDPFTFAGTQIAGWMLSHVEIYRRTLDALVGNPDIVEAYSETWKNISEELTKIGSDWRTAVEKDLATWSGETAGAYRDRAATLVDHIDAAGGAAAALAVTMEKTAKIVDAVRTLVQDILTELAGILIGYTAMILCSGGTATPFLTALALKQIAADGVKISTLLVKLGQAIIDIGPYKDALASILTALQEPTGAQA